MPPWLKREESRRRSASAKAMKMGSLFFFPAPVAVEEAPGGIDDYRAIECHGTAGNKRRLRHEAHQQQGINQT